MLEDFAGVCGLPNAIGIEEASEGSLLVCIGAKTVEVSSGARRVEENH